MFVLLCEERGANIYSYGLNTLFKLLLKWSRKRDFIQKLQHSMDANPQLFVTLSLEQAGHIFEYAMFVGKGKPHNAQTMKASMQKSTTSPALKKSSPWQTNYLQQAYGGYSRGHVNMKHQKKRI